MICLSVWTAATKKDLDFPSHYSKMPEPLYVSTIISATLNLRMKIILCRMQVPLSELVYRLLDKEKIEETVQKRLYGDRS